VERQGVKTVSRRFRAEKRKSRVAMGKGGDLCCNGADGSFARDGSADMVRDRTAGQKCSLYERGPSEMMREGSGSENMNA